MGNCGEQSGAIRIDKELVSFLRIWNGNGEERWMENTGRRSLEIKVSFFFRSLFIRGVI
jgi:hypothetical protein